MRYLTDIRKFFKQLRKRSGLFLVFAVLGILCVAIGVGIIVIGEWRAFESERSIAVKQTPEETARFHRLIDGASVSRESEIDPPLSAVVVDNIAEARPQAGIADALFVWEVPVEGGMTRLVAIVPLEDNTKSYKLSATSSSTRIGPVRSVRPYMLDLAREFAAPLFHVGGSPEALSRVRAGEFTVNEFFRGRFFYRDRSRPRPHNVFTTPERMREALAADQFTAEGVGGNAWTFTEFPKNENASSSVSIHFGAVSAEWRYDPATGQYLRFEDGAPHTDEQGRQISAANVLLQAAPIQILDAVGRRRIDLYGVGRGIAYRNGETIEAEWRHEGKNARTRWYRRDTGEEIIFSRGATWVEIAGEGMVERDE